VIVPGRGLSRGLSLVERILLLSGGIDRSRGLMVTGENSDPSRGLSLIGTSPTF
jgi:hypothetical protein